MTQYIAFALLGLGSGAVFAVLAIGVVLSYRSAGVVNFATGAIALYGAYCYSTFRDGRLLVLLPGLPTSVDIGGDPGVAASMVGAVGLSGLLGAVLYLVVFRPLRSAPPVAKAVGALGVMVALQAMFATRLGTTPVAVAPIFSRNAYTIGDTQVPGDRLWFAAVVALLAAALAVAMRFTRFGTATRAAAESERGAIITGLSPHRIGAINWALSSAMAGLGGVLIAPIVPLTPGAYTLMIVPALAAALIGNLQSVAVAAAVGLAIGMAQSEATLLQSQHDWLPRQGLAEAIPLVLIVGYLVVRGRPLPDRGALVTRTLARAPRPQRIAAPAVVGSVVGIAGLVLTSGSYRAALISSLILGVIALSLVVVTGYAGQVSLAQLALAGVGAFLLSRLTVDAGIPFPIAPLLAAIGAAVVGTLFGLPALRIRGLPVAVVTLALAVGLEAFWFRNPDLTGSFNGATVEPPTFLGIELGPGAGDEYPRLQFGLVCLVCLVAVAAFVAWLRRSHLGSTMVALRANERAAAALGIDVARTKLTAFCIGAFIAGLGGTLLAYQQTIASPDVYSAFVGFGMFATVYVAGLTSVTGAVLAGVLGAGGIAYVLLLRVAESVGSWYDVVLGVALVVNVIRFPEGIAGGLRRIGDRLTAAPRRRGASALTSVPALRDEDRTPKPRPPVELGRPLLRASGLTVRYGGVVAVDDVSFTVPEGAIVGLIGPNGAGKTTVIDALSGFASCVGTVQLGDDPLSGLPPHVRSRRGLGRTFQALELWDDLTVAENLGVARAATSGSPIGDVLELLQLAELRDRPVRELSQGQRQLVSVARALGTSPRVLLLDEPAAGLDSRDSAWLGERLRDIREAGVTLVLVDHDMNLVLDVCDEIHVLELGRVIASGSPAVVRADPAVAAAYLGSAHCNVEAAR